MTDPAAAPRGPSESERLYWHCEVCGNHEPAQPEYEHGDKEPCCLCPNGTARVVTLKEGAAIEQRLALAGAPVKNPISAGSAMRMPSEQALAVERAISEYLTLTEFVAAEEHEHVAELIQAAIAEARRGATLTDAERQVVESAIQWQAAYERELEAADGTSEAVDAASNSAYREVLLDTDVQRLLTLRAPHTSHQQEIK